MSTREAARGNSAPGSRRKIVLISEIRWWRQNGQTLTMEVQFIFGCVALVSGILQLFRPAWVIRMGKRYFPTLRRFDLSTPIYDSRFGTLYVRIVGALVTFLGALIMVSAALQR
jgi:hypothetical protein